MRTPIFVWACIFLISNSVSPANQSADKDVVLRLLNEGLGVADTTIVNASLEGCVLEIESIPRPLRTNVEESRLFRTTIVVDLKLLVTNVRTTTVHELERLDYISWQYTDDYRKLDRELITFSQILSADYPKDGQTTGFEQEQLVSDAFSEELKFRGINSFVSVEYYDGQVFVSPLPTAFFRIPIAKTFADEFIYALDGYKLQSCL